MNDTIKTPAAEALLCKRGLAAYLSVSTRTLDRLRQVEGAFPKPYLVGGSPRWAPEEIRAWLKDRREVERDRARRIGRLSRVVNSDPHKSAE